MNPINSNYNIKNQPSFSALLNLNAAEGMIKPKEVQILENLVSKIGKKTDIIIVDIGKTEFVGWGKRL